MTKLAVFSPTAVQPEREITAIIIAAILKINFFIPQNPPKPTIRSATQDKRITANKKVSIPTLFCEKVWGGKYIDFV